MANASSGLVKARWRGCPAELPDKTQLIPGATIVELTRGEAEQSDFWEIVGKTGGKDAD